MQADERIHVCYALNDKTGHYSKFLGTSIFSLLSNTLSKVTVHILCDNTLSAQNRDFLTRTVRRFEQQVFFYDVSEIKEIAEYLRCLPEIFEQYFTPACLYRLIVWKILPGYIKKIIYLDADTIIHLDIVTLWAEPTGGGLAAVVDPVIKSIPSKRSLSVFNHDIYFNAGVMILERAQFCLPDWKGKIVWFLRHFPNLQYSDQDVLNYYYSDKYYSLKPCYNIIVGYERFCQRQAVEPRIYHYSGPANTFDFDDVYNQLFFQYFTKTLWCNTDFLSRMWSVVQNVHDTRTELLQEAVRAFPQKRRVVLGPEKDKKKICRILALLDNEIYIAYNPHIEFNPSCFAELRGALVFLLFGESYEKLKTLFIAEKYKENKDFFQGDDFLKAEEGGLLINTHDVFKQL